MRTPCSRTLIGVFKSFFHSSVVCKYATLQPALHRLSIRRLVVWSVGWLVQASKSALQTSNQPYSNLPSRSQSALQASNLLSQADSWLERANFRSERVDFRPDRANFRPNRADFRPERAWGRRTDRRTDGQIDE